MHDRRGTETAAALWVFCLEQMPFTRVGAQDFASGGNLESFGHRFPCFNAFWTSHNITSLSFLKSADYRFSGDYMQEVFFVDFGPISKTTFKPLAEIMF